MSRTTIKTKPGRQPSVGQAMIVGTAAAASLLSITFNWFERICMILTPYEAIQADEYVLVLLFVAIGALAVYALRERQLRLELTAHDQERCAALAAARTDYLTGLPNRMALAEYIAAAEARPAANAAMFLLDLDGFKQVNDTFGHEAGDIVLKTIALRLSSLVDPEDELRIFRLGGDEFAMIRLGVADRHGLDAVAAAALAEVKKPIAVSMAVVTLSASIGVAPSDGVHADFDSLLRSADLAMFHAKHFGAGRTCFAGEAISSQPHMLHCSGDPRLQYANSAKSTPTIQVRRSARPVYAVVGEGL